MAIPDFDASGNLPPGRHEAGEDDVDIVTVIEGPAFDELPAHRQLLVTSLIGGHYTEDFWQCDTYPVVAYPEDHVGHSKYRIAADRWEDYFGHDRDGSAKGFLVVP